MSPVTSSNGDTPSGSVSHHGNVAQVDRATAQIMRMHACVTLMHF